MFISKTAAQVASDDGSILLILQRARFALRGLF